jgi:hypothetical protein
MAFNWGVVLQLGDDLQDLHSDRERGSVTLFAQAAECGSLDSVTSRAFHFAGEVMQELQREAASPPDFSRLVARSSQMLYLQSAAAAHAFYSPQFLQHIEQQSPVRFEFIGRREKRFFGRSVACYQLFEQLTVQSSDQIV